MFMNMNLTIRGVDEEVFRKFKEVSIRRRMNLGNALTNAMRTWLEKERGREKSEKAFFRLETF